MNAIICNCVKKPEKNSGKRRNAVHMINFIYITFNRGFIKVLSKMTRRSGSLGFNFFIAKYNDLDVVKAWQAGKTSF